MVDKRNSDSRWGICLAVTKLNYSITGWDKCSFKTIEKHSIFIYSKKYSIRCIPASIGKSEHMNILDITKMH